MISRVFPWKFLQIHITSVSDCLCFTVKTCQIAAGTIMIRQFHDFFNLVFGGFLTFVTTVCWCLVVTVEPVSLGFAHNSSSSCTTKGRCRRKRRHRRHSAAPPPTSAAPPAASAQCRRRHRRRHRTVCWIEVKVAVLCAHQYMPWNLHLIKVLHNFWYFKHQIPTRFS